MTPNTSHQIAKWSLFVLAFVLLLLGLFYVLVILARHGGVVGGMSAYILGSILYEFSNALVTLLGIVAFVIAIGIVAIVQIAFKRWRSPPAK
jgi:membrane protein YqaA with SNARE-associated domain